jgi:hypothetical protein
LRKSLARQSPAPHPGGAPGFHLLGSISNGYESTAPANTRLGYAWAESGRSLNDLEVVMHYYTFDLNDVSSESLAREDALYAKLRDEVFEEGELAKFEEQSDDYQDGWWDGVTSFYIKEIGPGEPTVTAKIIQLRPKLSKSKPRRLYTPALASSKNHLGRFC